MQVDSIHPPLSSSSTTGQRLLKLLTGAGGLGRGLPPGLPLTPVALLLLALAQATSSEVASKAEAVEKLKNNMLKYNVLQRLVECIAALSTDSSSSGGSSKGPSIQQAANNSSRCGVVGVSLAAVQAAAPALHLAFVVLENSTFTCPDNISFLVQAQLSSDSEPAAEPPEGSGRGSANINSSSNDLNLNIDSSSSGSTSCSFPELLVAVARALLVGALESSSSTSSAGTSNSSSNSSSGSCRSALHAACSVLMNLSHQGEEAAAAVAGAGGLGLAVEVLQQSLGHALQDTHKLWRQVGAGGSGRGDVGAMHGPTVPGFGGKTEEVDC